MTPRRHDRPAKLSRVRFEAWEGGGILGHAYGPVIEALDHWGVPVEACAGTSAGAITALLRCLRASPERIRELQESTPWRRFASYRFPVILRLVLRGGWHSLDYARGWIAERVKEAGLPDGATFAALQRHTGRSLIVVATRYGRHRGGSMEAEPFIFSPERTPDAPVADAVLASMAVPLFWPPVEVCGWWYCDGGVAMNHPLSVFAEHPAEEIIGVRLDSGAEILFGSGSVALEPSRPGIGAIIAANAGMLRTISNRTFVPEVLWDRVVRVNVGEDDALRFAIRPERIAALREAGQQALDSWLGAK